jgi:hypothetical protein
MKRFGTLFIVILMSAPYAFVAQPAPEPPAQIQANPLPLTLNYVLRMMLENNLNVAANRLPPQVAQSLIDNDLSADPVFAEAVVLAVTCCNVRSLHGRNK